jgi:hypothetical protein
MKLTQILKKETVNQYLHRYDKEGAPIEFDKNYSNWYINGKKVSEEVFEKQKRRICLRQIALPTWPQPEAYVMVGDDDIVPILRTKLQVTKQYLPLPFYRK